MGAPKMVLRKPALRRVMDMNPIPRPSVTSIGDIPIPEGAQGMAINVIPGPRLETKVTVDRRFLDKDD